MDVMPLSTTTEVILSFFAVHGEPADPVKFDIAPEPEIVSTPASFSVHVRLLPQVPLVGPKPSESCAIAAEHIKDKQMITTAIICLRITEIPPSKTY